MPRNVCFTLLHIFSIGFKSGLYSGRNIHLAPCEAIIDCTRSDLCTLRLSITTISPGCRVGERNFSIYASKIRRFTAPSNTILQVSPFSRNAERIVVRSHLPSGAWSLQRLPPSERPYNRVILVFAPVSSRKTKWRTGLFFWNIRHFSLFCFTSSLSCSLALRVFFI